MLIENLAGFWHCLLVPFLIRFAVAQQKNGIPLWVKRKQNTIRIASMLDAQLFHLRVLRHFRKSIGMRPPQPGTFFLQKTDAGVYGFLFFDRKAIPPFPEFVRKLHFPCHSW